MKPQKRSFCEKTLLLIRAELFVIILFSILGLLVLCGKLLCPASWRPAAELLLIFIPAAGIFLTVLAYRKTGGYMTVCQKLQNGEMDEDAVRYMGTLIPGLDQTIDRLKKMSDRQNMIRLSTKQAEFLALQNQINPHFLYNTLDAIRGDALCIGATALADTTEALSTFFRYTITNVGNLVTVEEELDNVDNYFKIQKYRFDDKINLRVKFVGDEKELKKMYCPKLSIQPIVENAIFHGLENKSGKGEVCIHLEVIEDKLHIDILDNGSGIPEDRLLLLNEEFDRMSADYAPEEPSDKAGGIALKNVCRRIRLLFGDEFGLHINSVSGIGTRMEMTLPAAVKSDEL